MIPTLIWSLQAVFLVAAHLILGGAVCWVLKKALNDPHVETWRARYHRTRALIAEMEAAEAREYRRAVLGVRSSSGRHYASRNIRSSNGRYVKHNGWKFGRARSGEKPIWNPYR